MTGGRRFAEPALAVPVEPASGLAASRFDQAQARVLTGVSGHFCAAHHGPDGELHGHTWSVTAWFETPARCDVRCYKAALETLLSSWDHKTLSDELAWGEDIARAVGTMVNCVEVVVSRPLEGFHARWIA